MKDLKNRLWIAGAFLMLALCAAVNLTGSWFEYSPATEWNLLMSLAYLAFWVALRSAPGTLSSGRGRFGWWQA